MLIERHREKLLNAMIYFIANTRYCHTLKLFKLLNFMDFEAFRQTGKSVTGLTYKAWKQGPVPNELWGELVHGPGQDLREAVAINQIKDDLTQQLLWRDIKPRRAADMRYFSKREVAIMDRMIELFRDARAEDMSRISHAHRMPWSAVYKGGSGSGDSIPYELAIESETFMADRPGLTAEEVSARNELFQIAK